MLRFPHKGTSLDSTKKLKDFFAMTELAPIRGWGANPYYYGGKMKLLKMEEIGAV